MYSEGSSKPTRRVSGNKKNNEMKTDFTFDELSKVFAMMVKIENVAAKQIESEKAYEEKSKIFEAEFEKCGYTFFNASEELHAMFYEKIALGDEKEKAERKAYKAIKDLAALLGIGEGYCDWYEDEIKEYIERKWYFNITKVVGRCKFLAINAVQKIR